MVNVFSVSTNGRKDADSSRIIDLQLLPDNELLDIWENAQLAAIAFAERGGNSEIHNKYSRAALLELQRRLALRPYGFLLGVNESEYI